MIQYLENENCKLVSGIMGTTLGNRHTQRNLSRCHVVHHRYHMMWIGFKFRLECFVGLGQRAHFVRL
jgi:hypothetical protein